MIRYHVSPAALRRRIDALDPDWRARAETHTDHLELLGRFEEAPNNTSWSRIKRAFVEIQHNKCAWCERKLEDAEHGLIEHDVDHFRPKNAVRAWPPPRHPTTYPFPTGAPLPGGYYLLSYQYENYITYCKTCNTILKNDGFPIAGARRHPPSRRVVDHEAEQPLLPFPLGTRGPDPEKLMRFEGVMALPRHRRGYRAQIAQVTIDFFDLNGRDNLFQERARVVIGVWLASQLPDHSQRDEYINLFCADAAPHASCARSFRKLISEDATQAARLKDAAARLL
jgi:hypothetical protein